MSSYVHPIELALQRRDAVSMNHRVKALLASYFELVFLVNQQPHSGESECCSSRRCCVRRCHRKLRRELERCCRRCRMAMWCDGRIPC
jgi:hypothetical protein